MENNHPVRILVVDDEPPIRKFLRTSLSGAGYDVSEAASVKEGLLLATQEQPDVVLLDLGLPDQDGLEFLRRFREWSQTPVIVLSAREQERDKVKALDAGADDYLTKPFGLNELQARLRVALRRVASESSAGGAVFQIGELKVDLAARRVTLRNEPVTLTNLEYRLLTTLVRHAGKVVTHRILLKEVWGPDAVQETHYLRVFIATLRKKIELDSTQPRYLITEQGVGYRLATDGE